MRCGSTTSTKGGGVEIASTSPVPWWRRTPNTCPHNWPAIDYLAGQSSSWVAVACPDPRPDPGAWPLDPAGDDQGVDGGRQRRPPQPEGTKRSTPYPAQQ